MQVKLTDTIKQYHHLTHNHLADKSGAVLLTVVILILVIGVTGVAIYSLTTTSTFSQLSSQNATQAFYLAESGFRVVAEEYNYASGNKNTVLETLHNKTLSLPANAGQFGIRLYPYWFYVNSAYSSGEATISAKMPGGIPLRDPSDQSSPMISIPGTGSLKLRGKTRHALITNSSVSGDVITFTLDTSVTPPGFPYDIQTGEELFLVYEDNTTPSQTINQAASMTLPGSNTTAQILPAENGSFRIYNENNDKMDYTYRERLPAVIDPANPPATITLTQVDHQNSADVSVFPFQVDINTEFYLGKNLAVFSTSTFGHGNMSGSKTDGNYTDVGIDAGFSTGKETISFADDIQDFSPKMGATGGGEILEGSANAPITVDTTTKEVELGKKLAGRYGSIWYAGDTDIASCIEGRCSLGKGYRAYFEFQLDDVDTDSDSGDYGDGFTFSIISGNEDSPGSYRNTADDTGSGGEYLGYAGPGLDNGLQPPKIGLEFDTFHNYGAGNMCGNNSRRDDTPVANHAALVYWGEDSPGSFDATGGHLSLGTADWSSNEGTICFWFKRDNINYGNGSSSGDRLWGQNANMEIRFSGDGDDIILDWGDSDSLTKFNHPFTAQDTWYFMAITWNESNGHLNIYWGSESIPPGLLASTTTWSQIVSGVGVNENLFMNSSGGNLSKNFQVDGKGAELRYYNMALDTSNLSEINSIYNARSSATVPQAYFPLQADLINVGFSGATAATIGSTGWSDSIPTAYACGIAAETYDDNRHGTGGVTTPLNSLNTNDGNGNDGYHQVTKGADINNWLEDGLPHQARMELIRPLVPSVDGVVGGTDFEYQIKIWIDCPDCSPAELNQFQDVKASFTAWAPLIQKTIANGNQLVLNQTIHDEFKKILFGFTQGTGGATQNITLRDFEIYFPKRYPVANLATW